MENNNNNTDESDDKLGKVFSSLFLDQVNVQDTNAILASQKHIIETLDSANEHLKESNTQCHDSFRVAVKDFNSHVQTLNTIKKDLDGIFRRIRLMKTKLSKKYENNYEIANQQFGKRKGSDEDEDEENDEENEINKNENENKSSEQQQQDPK